MSVRVRNQLRRELRPFELRLILSAAPPIILSPELITAADDTCHHCRHLQNRLIPSSPMPPFLTGRPMRHYPRLRASHLASRQSLRIAYCLRLPASTPLSRFHLRLIARIFHTAFQIQSHFILCIDWLACLLNMHDTITRLLDAQKSPSSVSVLVLVLVLSLHPPHVPASTVVIRPPPAARSHACSLSSAPPPTGTCPR